MKDVSENDTQKVDILNTENVLAKRDQLLTLLKIHNINGISEKNLPTSKPSKCKCPLCIEADSLLLNEFEINNQYVLNDDSSVHYNYQNNKAIHFDIYDSNFKVSDNSVCASEGNCTTDNCFCGNNSVSNCFPDKNLPITEIPKHIWVDDLRSLIKKNEETFITSKNSSNSFLAPKRNTRRRRRIKNKLVNTTKQMFSALCEFCKNSKYSCKCKRQHSIKNIYKLGDMPSLGYHGSYKSNRY